jgi:hypothetical protein
MLKKSLVLSIAIILTVFLPILGEVTLVQVQPNSELSTAERDTSLGIVDAAQITVSCPIPTTLREIPVLNTVTRSDLTADRAKSIANDLFNISAIPVRSPYFKAYRIHTTLSDLWITDYGSLNYFETTFVTTSNPLTANQATVIAEQFMQKVETYNLTPQNPHVKLEFSHVIVGSETGTVDNLYAQYWDVVFTVKFDGLTIAEPRISVGANGRIVAVQGFWREVNSKGTASVLTPQQAIAKIPTAGDPRRLNNVNQINITQISLKYWDDETVEESQDYLQPIYAFSCILTNDSNETSFAVLRIPATK